MENTEVEQETVKVPPMTLKQRFENLKDAIEDIKVAAVSIFTPIKNLDDLNAQIELLKGERRTRGLGTNGAAPVSMTIPTFETMLLKAPMYHSGKEEDFYV